MNVLLIRVAWLLVVLAGCYDTDTENAHDDAKLEMDGGAIEHASDAQAGEAPRDASEPHADVVDGGRSHLQVWLGFAHMKDGRAGLVCGSETELLTQYRALVLLEVDAEGALKAASLTVGEGEGASLPEVEDPDAYYPPDPPWNWHACPMRGLVPGFEYTAYEALLDGGRFSASIRPSEVVKPWCELQPSYPASPPAAMLWAADYLCRPTDRFADIFELNEAVPTADDLSIYFPEELCFRVNAPCTCDAQSCTASRYGAMHLDLVVDGDSMTGRFGWMEIKLERQTSELP